MKDDEERDEKICLFFNFTRLAFSSNYFLIRFSKTTFVLFRSYEKTMWAITKIQSHVRKMIAVRNYRKLRVN